MPPSRSLPSIASRGSMCRRDKRLLVLLFLLLTPFYQFHAQRFARTRCCWRPGRSPPIASCARSRRARSRGRPPPAPRPALAMLGKYYSIYLVAAFIVAALAHPARWTYLRSPSPWVSAAVGLIVLAPHLRWLMTSTFTPFDYVYAAHGHSALAARDRERRKLSPGRARLCRAAHRDLRDRGPSRCAHARARPSGRPIRTGACWSCCWRHSFCSRRCRRRSSASS